MQDCRDCTHYNYRADKCRLGADKNDCTDYEPQYKSFDWEEQEVE